MDNSKEAHVNEVKKLKVKGLAKEMGRKTVMVVSIKGLPSAQFQDIKKKLRNKGKIQVVKKSLVNFALEHCGIKELHDLVPYVDDSTAMLFSDKDAFEISGILSNEKSSTKAKAGQIAPYDIEVKAGPTELIPGPDISALSAVGLAPKVEHGKISVMQDKVIIKEGKEISEAVASIMAKLDIIPFEIGIEPIAVFDGETKKIYFDIKIDKQGMIEAIENDFERSLAFAVEMRIVNDSTIDFIIGRAGIEEMVISALIGEETKEKNKEEQVVEETNTEEVKADEAVTESE